MNSETLYGRNRVECLLTIPFLDQVVFREKGYVIFFFSLPMHMSIYGV